MQETEIKPVNTDTRGYTQEFVCQNCKAEILISYCCKSIDYNYCPYCGMKSK